MESEDTAGSAGRQGRVLAIDLGEKRIGLALSDPLRITGQPIGRVDVSASDGHFREILELISREEVTVVVIGLPLLLSGEEGGGARAARDFAERLEAELPGVVVRLWDERLTTVQAERVMIAGNVRRRRRREKIDSLAATLILQSFLDSGAAAS